MSDLGSQFSHSAKLGDEQILRLVYVFCHGLSVAQAARMAGVTPKTARAYYIALRARLTKARFNRWHGVNAMLVNISPEITAELIKPAFFECLAECHANEKCQQNFRLGYRAERLCKACPLRGKFPSEESLHSALSPIDMVRDFYRRLGIRREKDRDRVSLFRERLIHCLSVSTALANSKSRSDGLKDPTERDYLSLGTLLDDLMEDLAEEPL